MSDSLAHTEDSTDSLQRRRLLAQLDLSFVELTDDASAAIDEICLLLPVVDHPRIFDLLAEADWEAARIEIIKLPQTRSIERWLEHRCC